MGIKEKEEPEKSDWEKTLDRRRANIGFLSRTDAFAEPTPAQMAAALKKETESWQASKGRSGWKVSSVYKVPRGAGTNLRIDPNWEAERRERAIKAYMETPMDKGNVLKSLGIDVERYERASMAKKVKRRLKKHIEKKKQEFAEDPSFWENLLVNFLPLIVVCFLTVLIWFLTGRIK